MPKLSKMQKRLNQLSDEPFKFGSADCYAFTAALVKEWHGKDFSKLHRVYKTEKQADKYMEKFGGIEKLTTGTLGYSCKPLECEDGDVCSAMVPGGVALGFVFNGKGMFKGKKGVLELPLKDCRHGWRIK